MLGLASLVATLGISRTAGNQIIERFDELQATQVTVRSRSDGEQQERQGGGTALPWDVESRLLGLNGVVAAGAVADVPNPGNVRTVPLVDPEGRSELTVPVLAASPGFVDAVRGHLSSGRAFDAGHVQRGDRVAVDRRRPGRRARHRRRRPPARACSSARSCSPSSASSTRRRATAACSAR